MSLKTPKTKQNSTNSPRAWQRMLSGRRLNLLEPSPLDVEIEDIAHGLARVARWNGQTAGPVSYSVAQHSVDVLDIACRLAPGLAPAWQMAALLHDAPEYVIGDLISPFKAAVGSNYKEMERRIQDAIHIRFGLPGQLPDDVEKLIKKSDRLCAWYEAVQIAGFSKSEAGKLFSPPKSPPDFDISPLLPEDACDLFLDRFHKLQALMGKSA